MSKALIQLVAYRRATTTSSIYDLKPFYLDITGSPNISVNYNFEDIKNPEKRKTDFSQKFKLPFTNTNNRFFEHWYNVNVEKLVYSQNDAIECKVLVNGNEVLSGNLKLMGVYKKAGYYECVVLGKISNLFTAVGGQSLKNAFETADETSGNLIPDTDLDHYFTTGNIEDSWKGSSSDFTNTAGVSLRDSVGNVQKVMYPLRIRGEERFIYDNAGTYDIWLSNNYPSTGDFFETSLEDRNVLERQTPAIQLRTVLEKIFSKAGFTWTSTFLDSEYFRRLYMTTGDHDTGGSVKITPAVATLGTSFKIVNNDACRVTPAWCPRAWATSSDYSTGSACETGFASWGYAAPANGGAVATGVPNNSRECPLESKITGPALDNNFIVGPIESFQYYFQPPTTLEYSAQFRAHLDTSASYACAGNNVVGAFFSFQWWDDLAGAVMDEQTQYYVLLDGTETYVDLTVTSTLQAGGRYMPGYYLVIVYGESNNENSYVEIGLNTKMIDSDGSEQNYIIQVQPTSSGSGSVYTPYGGVVNVPENIDPELKQKDFLKDIIQRFNLVVVPDAEDSTNLIVEPFKDYVGSGETRYWSDKIDTSKEIIIKPTTALQKQGIKLTDKESPDFYNKYVSEFLRLQNVWGHYSEEYNNTFASEGELKNTPMFAPYIIDRPHKVGNVGGDDGFEPDMSNVGLQHLNSYNSETGDMENQKTPPFLFYYCGTTVPLGNSSSYPFDQISLNFIYQSGVYDGDTPVWFWYPFPTYPLCSAYEMSGTALINGGASRSLYWSNKYNDWARNLDQWNVDGAIDGTLYNVYWKDYIKELYSEDSRLLELYLNLSSTDIYKFSFKDVIFIKDNYYRVLKIHNYQVGGNTSTKVLLLKVPDLTGTPCLDAGCTTSNYLNNGSPTLWGMYMWIDPAGGFTWVTNQACCDCVDGDFTVFDPTTGDGTCADPDYYDEPPTTATETMAMGMPPLPGSSGTQPKKTGSSAKTIELHTANFVDATTKKFKSQYRDGFAMTDDGVSFISPTSKFARRTLKVQNTVYNMIGQTIGTGTREIRIENRENNIQIFPNTLSDIEIKITGYVSDGGFDVGKAFAYNGTVGFKFLNGTVTEVGGGAGGHWTGVYSDLTGVIGHPTFYIRISQDTPQQPNRLIITATCGSANPLTVVDYTAELKLTTTELSKAISAKQFYAEWEQLERLTLGYIEFEDRASLTYLEWN